MSNTLERRLSRLECGTADTPGMLIHWTIDEEAQALNATASGSPGGTEKGMRTSWSGSWNLFLLPLEKSCGLKNRRREQHL